MGRPKLPVKRTVYIKTHPLKLQRKREATYAKWEAHNKATLLKEKKNPDKIYFAKSFGRTELIKYARLQDKLKWQYPLNKIK